VIAIPAFKKINNQTNDDTKKSQTRKQSNKVKKIVVTP
jgi:hypothetical protein